MHSVVAAAAAHLGLLVVALLVAVFFALFGGFSGGRLTPLQLQPCRRLSTTEV